MKSERGLIGSADRLLVALGLLASTGLLHAADFCCQCTAESSKTVSASGRLAAIGQCSLACGTPTTKIAPGKCAEPAPAAGPTPAAAPTSATGGGVVLAYQSPDCSGNPIRVTASTPRVGQSGVLSFQMESGASASVWEKADYAGRGTAPVGPTLCVSPGFAIQSIQLQ